MGRAREEADLAAELVDLSRLDQNQLRQRWTSWYATEPPARMSRTMLLGAIAYRMQEAVHGGLPATTRRYLTNAAADAAAVPPVRQLKPGTVLLREWQGTTHPVTIQTDGVHYRDRIYRSLSAVAREISGIHRSGPEFFGLKSHGKG